MRKRWLFLIGTAAVLLLGIVLIVSLDRRPPARPTAPDLMVQNMPDAPPAAVRAEASTDSLAIAAPVMVSAPPEEGTSGPSAPIAVSVPRLAYTYRLGYRLPGTAIPKAQQAHLALCNRLGPARCQLVGMNRKSGDDSYASGTLSLRVDSGIAQHFSDDLGKAIAEAGGRPVDTSINAQDVSKDMVDTAARLRQREILVARLTEILRNRSGKVGDLVDAERSVADAQQELDQAKSWLAELQGRVALSIFEISYEAAAPTATPAKSGWKLSDSIGDSAGSFLIALTAILTVVIFLAPWLLIATPFALFARSRLRKRAAEEEPLTQA